MYLCKIMGKVIFNNAFLRGVTDPGEIEISLNPLFKTISRFGNEPFEGWLMDEEFPYYSKIGDIIFGRLGKSVEEKDPKKSRFGVFKTDEKENLVLLNYY